MKIAVSNANIARARIQRAHPAAKRNIRQYVSNINTFTYRWYVVQIFYDFTYTTLDILAVYTRTFNFSKVIFALVRYKSDASSEQHAPALVYFYIYLFFGRHVLLSTVMAGKKKKKSPVKRTKIIKPSDIFSYLERHHRAIVAPIL